MIGETENYVKKLFSSLKKVCLFASAGTYKAQLYDTFFYEVNIQLMIHSLYEQVMSKKV